MDLQSFIIKTKVQVQQWRNYTSCDIIVNPLRNSSKCQLTLIDFTLSKPRRFYSSMWNPLGMKGLNAWRQFCFPYRKFSQRDCAQEHKSQRPNNPTQNSACIIFCYQVQLLLLTNRLAYKLIYR